MKKPTTSGTTWWPINRPNRSGIPNEIIGMSMFVIVEVMLFTALLSAYFVTRSGVPEWPPPDQPRLPYAITIFNTVLLLVSGVLLHHAGKRRHQPKAWHGTFYDLLCSSILLGSIFVCSQGWEWMRLIKHGLTLQSSLYGSTFYVIVGAHGLHALGAILYLGWILMHLLVHHELDKGHLAAAQVFWYFVVGIWPILFFTLYVL